MLKILVTFIIAALALDALDRGDCAIWSDEAGDEVCESCARTAIEPVMLRDGSVVREAACQEDRP